MSPQIVTRSIPSGTSQFTNSKTVAGNGSYTSDAFTTLAAGTYRWVAAYSGDAGNNPVTTLCNDPAETDRYQIAVKRDAQGRGGSMSLVDGVGLGDELMVGMPTSSAVELVSTIAPPSESWGIAA